MSISTTLAEEISSLSVADRWQLVHVILDTLASDQFPPGLSQEQMADLDRRCNDLDTSPNNVLTWEQIRNHIRGPG